MLLVEDSIQSMLDACAEAYEWESWQAKQVGLCKWNLSVEFEGQVYQKHFLTKSALFYKVLEIYKRSLNSE